MVLRWIATLAFRAAWRAVVLVLFVLFGIWLWGSGGHFP